MLPGVAQVLPGVKEMLSGVAQVLPGVFNMEVYMIKEYEKNKFDDNYAAVPLQLLLWQADLQKKQGRHTYAAVVLARLHTLWQYRTKLSIAEDENGFLMLTVNDLFGFFEESISPRMLDETLRELERQAIITRFADKLLLDLYEYDNILNSYDITNYQCKYIKIYFFALRYERIYHSKLRVALVLSKFIDDAAAGYFMTEMSQGYIHEKLCGLFSIMQERKIIDALKEDNILKVNYAHSKEKDETWSTRRHFELSIEKIDAIRKEHIDAYAVSKSKKTYTKIEFTDLSEYKKEQLNKNKTEYTNRNSFDSSSRKSRDGVVSLSHTPEEIANLRAMQAQIDDFAVDDSDDDGPWVF